jgi:hypothetical protein
LADRPIALETRLLREDRDASSVRNCDLTLRCGVKTGDDPQQRRFSGAIDANERHVLPVCDLERNILEDLVGAKCLGELVDCEDCRWRHGLSSSALGRLRRQSARRWQNAVCCPV